MFEWLHTAAMLITRPLASALWLHFCRMKNTSSTMVLVRLPSAVSSMRIAFWTLSSM